VPAPADQASLRELLISAGLEVLQQDGLGLGTQALSYRRVFDHLEQVYGVTVARASVHERIWASHDHFRHDVVAATISHLPTDLLADLADQLAGRIVDQYLRGLDLDERMSETTRWLAPSSFDLISSLPELRKVQLAKAIATSGTPLRAEDLAGSLRDRGDSILAASRVRLRHLTALLGLRHRSAIVDEDTAHDLLGVISINCNVGGFLDANAGSDDIRRPLELNGVPADDPLPWTLVAIGMISVMTLLFEQGEEPPAELPEPQLPPPPVPPTIHVDPLARRRTRAELRELVVAAGVEILLASSLDLRPESLGYTSVFDHVERTRGMKIYRASIHRKIWTCHDQYWLDVLSRALETGAAPDASTVAELDAASQQPVSDPDERIAAAMDLIGALAATDTSSSLASPEFLRRQSIKAALTVEPEAEPFASLRRVVHATGGKRIEQLQDVIRRLILPLGFEVRPERGIDTDEALRVLATLYLTASAGAVFDQASGVEPRTKTYTIQLPGRPEPEQWAAISIGCWAVFNYLFRLSPDDGPGGSTR
jgi:hypothetical protein